MTIDAEFTEIFRSQRGRVLATLIRSLGDFDLAEESLHKAFASAGRRGRRQL